MITTAVAASQTGPEAPWSALGSLGLVALVAPLIPGVATKTRALLTGRRGPPVWQLYADLRKLLRKGAVYSPTTTWAFRLAPLAAVATTLLAATIVPLDGRGALVSFTGDAVAFAYLLGLGRFLLVLGALDTGSSFEGMGASREVSFASLVEPGLFVALVALGVASAASVAHRNVRRGALAALANRRAVGDPGGRQPVRADARRVRAGAGG